MRIALDCRTVTSPKTGDRTYALNLMRALARVDSVNDYLLYTWDQTDLTNAGQPNFHPISLPASPRWTWTPISLPRDLKRRGATLAHVQYIIPPFSPCPVVTTIHDISFRRFPRLFPAKHRVLLNLLIPFAARRSAAVITGSEATKCDLIELYRISAEKIAVTPYAADDSFRPMQKDEARRIVQERLNLPIPYVLAVGVLQPRKNLPRLVRAYNRIAARFPHRLVLVGKPGWEATELGEAVAGSPAGREPVFAGYVEDEDLPALYAAADLFVYPSLYEGFGLVILEAMACGTAVLTSNTSSIPEVAGEAASMVDPLDEDAISESLERLLECSEERDRLASLGPARAACFSWDRTAGQTIDVYDRVAGRLP